MPKPDRIDAQTGLNLLRAGGKAVGYDRLLRDMVARSFPHRGSAMPDDCVTDFRLSARVAVALWQNR